jgi:hypothetical protein
MFFVTFIYVKNKSIGTYFMQHVIYPYKVHKSMIFKIKITKL